MILPTGSASTLLPSCTGAIFLSLTVPCILLLTLLVLHSYYFPPFLLQFKPLPSFSLIVIIILCLPLDRVFGPECCTRQVYDQGAKEVAFSVVSGVNGVASLSNLHFTLPPFSSFSFFIYFTWFSASVFAYGQTSSGKTYTMSGITHCTLVDIYDYIDKVNFKKTASSYLTSPFYICSRGS